MRFITKKKLSFAAGLLFIVGLAFLQPHIIFAQSTTIDPKDLTPQNGWNCNSSNTSCTNTLKTSPYYGKRYVCTNATPLNAGSDGAPQTIKCSLENPDGTSVVDVTTYNGGTRTTYNEQTDAQGNITNVTQPTTIDDTGGGGSCGVTTVLEPWKWGNCIANAIGAVILGIANFFLAIAGVVFNWVVFKTVFEFGSLIGNSEGLLTAWGILRDIGNMILLFGFIFLGLATILDLHSFPVKKALPRLLIFAILMNFSLFAAEAVIDVSNAFSSVVYSQADTDQCLSGDLENCAINYGLAGHIMKSTGLSTMFAINEFSESTFETTAIYIALALFATIGAVVFIAASVMLAMRFITLTFLMVSAPIGFAGMAIPPLEQYAKKWWNMLLSQSFFAPVLLLLIFISLKITDTFNTGTTENGLAGALTQQNASVMGVIMVFVLVIGFLIASLIAARSMGASGANFAVKTASGMVYGGMGYIGRNTAGKGFSRVNDNIRSSRFGQTRFGRRVATLTEKGAKASFDVRGTKAASALGKNIGDMGKPAKDGYVGQVKRGTEAYTKYAGTLKQTDEAKRMLELLNQEKVEAAKAKETAEQGKKNAETEWGTDRKELQDRINKIQSKESSRTQELSLQQKRVEAALTSGDLTKQAEEEAKLKRLTEQYESDRERDQEELNGIQETLKAGEEAHKQNIERFNADIKAADEKSKAADLAIKGDMDKGIAGYDENSSKRAFGINIRNSKFPVKGESRKKAFEEIKKDLKKSKAEKAIEGLKKSIDSGKDDTTHKLDEVKEALEEDTKATKDADHGHDGH